VIAVVVAELVKQKPNMTPLAIGAKFSLIGMMSAETRERKSGSHPPQQIEGDIQYTVSRSDGDSLLVVHTSDP
jgi:hypothetical protein